MDILGAAKGNLLRFIPSALKKPSALKRRYGRAADNMGFRPGTRVVVTDEDGDEVLARVVEQLGTLVRVELLDDGEIEEVEASALRRAPRRRRAAAAEVVPEVDAESEPFDAG